MMNGFPENTKFCHAWRPYQRRGLHDFDEHLEDRHWRRHVGRANLIYTRSTDGKKALLQAKERWLATRFQTECETRIRWG